MTLSVHYLIEAPASQEKGEHVSSQRQELNVEIRQAGKSTSRALRNKMQVPAVVYGSGKNVNIFIDERQVRKFNTRAFENSLFTLKSSDSSVNNVVALMKDVSIHPLTRKPQHVDLFALDLKKPVRIKVEISFQGKPAGLAEGGLLNIVNRQVEIECLPTEIPDSFTLDISAMGVGDALHVSDLQVPASLKMLSTPDTTLAVVNLLEEEVVTPVATEAAAATAAAPTAEAGKAAASAPAAGKDAKAAAPAKDKK